MHTTSVQGFQTCKADNDTAAVIDEQTHTSDVGSCFISVAFRSREQS